MATTCTATAPEAVRTFRTYATARTYPFSAPISAPEPGKHQVNDRGSEIQNQCLLACYLIWHLRKAWAPLTFTDEHPPQRDNPVAAAQRSPEADAKASRKHHADGNPLRSFGGLLAHLATLTRNQIRYQDTTIEVPMLADPTPNQRRAFDLLDTPIPLTTAP